MPSLSKHLLSIMLILGCAACREEPPPPPVIPDAAPAGVVGTPAEAPTDQGPEKPLDIDRFLANITRLSSDAYGGRAPMSEGERLTLEFLETRFRAAGLAPLFGDSYRQAVDMVAVDADPETARMTFQHDGGERDLRYGEETVLWSSQARESASVEDSELVFVGYGIVAPEYGWNDYAGVEVRGKTVMVLINDPGFGSQDPGLFRGNSMTYYGRWTYKFEEAARQGAAAALIIHDREPATYGWNTVRNSWTGPRFRLASEKDGAGGLTLESWIRKPVASELVAATGRDLEALSREALTSEFRAVSLGITMNAGVDNSILRRQSYNVGARLEGGDIPEEIFVYTAHWDHLGTGESANPDEDVIFNGAVDNATGTAALIELGHAFAALPAPTRRSVAFLAVTGEESGLLGSAWYADHPAVPMSRTVGGINIDAMHVWGPTSDVVVVGYGSSELEDILITAAGRQNRVVKPEENPERGYYYRSDHFNFAKKGVPMLYAESGSDHRELGPEYVQGKSDEYVENRYHQPDDEVQPDWDLRGAMEDIELYFAIGREVADGDAWPQWYEGNEFRAIREKSRRR